MDEFESALMTETISTLIIAKVPDLWRYVYHILGLVYQRGVSHGCTGQFDHVFSETCEGMTCLSLSDKNIEIDERAEINPEYSQTIEMVKDVLENKPEIEKKDRILRLSLYGTQSETEMVILKRDREFIRKFEQDLAREHEISMQKFARFLEK